MERGSLATAYERVLDVLCVFRRVVASLYFPADIFNADNDIGNFKKGPEGPAVAVRLL